MFVCPSSAPPKQPPKERDAGGKTALSGNTSCIFTDLTTQRRHLRSRQVLQYRNRLLRSWAASVDAISYVDFDAMSTDEHHPPPCDADIHWQCWLRWPRHRQVRTRQHLHGPGSPAAKAQSLIAAKWRLELQRSRAFQHPPSHASACANGSTGPGRQ